MGNPNVMFNNFNLYNQKSYSKEEYKNKMNDLKDSMHGISKRELSKVMKNMNELADFLKIQAKFNLYSVNNCLLIKGQMPNATVFRDKDGWKKAGFKVIRPDKGFNIFEKETSISDGGKVGTYFNPKEVFDIIYTDYPLHNLDIQKPDEKDVLSSLVGSRPINFVPVERIDGSDKNALYDKDKNCIYVVKGAEVNALIQDLVYEEAKMFMVEKDYDENATRFNSLCISYMFCCKYGVDFPKEQFTKIENQFYTMETKTVKNELDMIRDTFETINSRIVEYSKQNRKNKEQVR